MLLPIRYRKCIWCDCSLNRFEGDADDSPSSEHLFPRSIFGVAVTRDCCKGCNSRLGRAVDTKLLKDGRILLAAREAGIKETELLSRFSGRGLDSLNREAQCTVKNGQRRFDPVFQPQGFRIGMVEGKIFPQDSKNAKAKMRDLATSDKSLLLNTAEIAQCVDDLFEAHLAKSGKEDVYCHKIKQGLRGVPAPRHLKLDGAYQPYETEWSIAKIAYETAAVLLPPDLFAMVWSALDQLKAFVEQQEAGRSVFIHESSTTVAQRYHEAKISVNGSAIEFNVTLFGKETWKLSFCVDQNGRPAILNAFELKLRNDFPSTESKSANVIVNGNEWRQQHGA